jgi:hypothetical protein
MLLQHEDQAGSMTNSIYRASEEDAGLLGTVILGFQFGRTCIQNSMTPSFLSLTFNIL